MATEKPKYQNFGNVGAMGDAARSDNNTFVQVGPDVTIDLVELARQLAQVRAEMKRISNSHDPEQDAAIGTIAQAETAARSGNISKALELLKEAGKWATDVAKSVAADVVKDAIQGKYSS